MSTTLQTPFGTANLDSNGYYHITSRKEGNHGKYLHRLIFEDFYKIILPDNIFIHHNDENPLNNNIWNLIPLTKKEHNMLHNTAEKHPFFNKSHKLSSMIKRSKYNNTTGYFRVSKIGNYYSYQYIDNNGKRRKLSSKSIQELKKKVLENNLLWIKLEDIK